MKARLGTLRSIRAPVWMILTALLMGCAAGEKPAYCSRDVVERGVFAGGNPLTGIFVSALMELGCIDPPARPVAHTPSPSVADCEQGGLPSVTDSSKRYTANGFSVLPPAGEGWCVTQQRDAMIGFATNKLVGTQVKEPPPFEEGYQTFAVGALILKAKDMDIATSEALKRFHEQWTAMGRGVIENGMEFEASLSNLETTSTTTSTSEIYTGFGAECVRHRFLMEEEGNPKFPGWVLLLNTEGVICRHPKTTNRLVDVQFSERRRKDWGDPEPEYAQLYREQARTTLTSIVFAAFTNDNER